MAPLENQLGLGHSHSAVAALVADPAVELVERQADMTVATDQNLSGVANIWGLDQIDQQGGNNDNIFRYFYPGTGVRIYIVDTGVWGGHNEYTSRRLLWGNWGCMGRIRGAMLTVMGLT
jgi:hypothetical protein